MTIELISYTATEILRDGSPIEIRPLRPQDRDSFLAAVGQVGTASMHRRFFGGKRHFSEKEIAFFITDVDFVNHVALIAVANDHDRPVIVGGARYIVIGPRRAEIAFAVVDLHQGRGIGTCLLRHLAFIARDAGFVELVADVLPDNTSMLKVFDKSGIRCEIVRQSDAIHIVLRLS